MTKCSHAFFPVICLKSSVLTDVVTWQIIMNAHCWQRLTAAIWLHRFKTENSWKCWVIIYDQVDGNSRSDSSNRVTHMFVSLCCRSVRDWPTAVSRWKLKAELWGNLQHPQTDGRWCWRDGRHRRNRWGETQLPFHEKEEFVSSTKTTLWCIIICLVCLHKFSLCI